MLNDFPNRDALIELARQIIGAKDTGRPHADLLAEFEKYSTCPDTASLFGADYYPEYIVDYAVNWKDYCRKVGRDELLKIVKRILDADGTEAEITLLLVTFCENCRHSAKSDLIYYPEDYFEGNRDPSAEEIVDKALAGE